MNNTNTIIIFLGCLTGIILFGKLFILPIKMIIKLALNSFLGGLIILLINWIGAFFNIHIGLNIFTAIFVRNTWNSRCNTINNIKNFHINIANFTKVNWLYL